LGRHKTFDMSFFILSVIACAAGLGVAWQSGVMRVLEISLNYLGFLIVLSPKILCGFFIAAAVPILIPREVLATWVGRESGAHGLLVASVAGALVPGGPMMIFPLAASFRLAGAGMPTIISFVSAWSLFGLNRTIIWEMSFLPVEFVLMRVLVCLPLPVLAGLVAHRVMR